MIKTIESTVAITCETRRVEFRLPLDPTDEQTALAIASIEFLSADQAAQGNAPIEGHVLVRTGTKGGGDMDLDPDP